MLGPDSPEKIRNIVDDAVRIFSAQIDRDLVVLAEKMDAEIIRLLAEKIAVLMLFEQVNDTPEVPYISVWLSGKSDISQVYISPRVVDLLGYSSEEVKKIGFAELADDRIVSFHEDSDRFEGKSVPRKKAERERRKEFLGNRTWKAFYRVKQKDGGAVWIMDKAVLTKFVNEKGSDVAYVSEGVLLEAEDIMAKIKAGR